MKRSICGSLALVWFLVASALGADQTLLSVGSVAPELNVQHWFPRADGKTQKVSKFEPGKVYVVEFWATWCGPCVQGMPHLAQLQREYAEKGVQIIGVSSEDVDTVNRFLQQGVPQRAEPNTKEKSAGPQTYAQLTSAYSLSCDPDESTEKSYMQAAYQSTIPKAFIVGKDGKIEWIGHPGEMDDVLRKVVADDWDRTEFGKTFLAGQHAELARAQLNEALHHRDFAKAIELIDKRLKSAEEPQEQLELRLTKVQVSLAQNNIAEATSRLQECFAFTGGRVDMVDLICWHVYEQSEQRKQDLTSLLKVSLTEGEKALTTAKDDALASLLDTVGHVAYKLGDRAKAIQLVTQATQLAVGENKEFSRQFLEQLKAVK